MTVATLMNRPCTITLRSTGTTEDDYGNLIDDEEFVDTVCEIQQKTRDEPEALGETSVTLWDAFFPAGTVTDTAASVDVEGLGVFEFVGDSWPVRNPRTQIESHVQATVKRVGPSEDGS